MIDLKDVPPVQGYRELPGSRMPAFRVFQLPLDLLPVSSSRLLSRAKRGPSSLTQVQFDSTPHGTIETTHCGQAESGAHLVFSRCDLNPEDPLFHSTACPQVVASWMLHPCTSPFCFTSFPVSHSQESHSPVKQLPFTLCFELVLQAEDGLQRCPHPNLGICSNTCGRFYSQGEATDGTSMFLS